MPKPNIDPFFNALSNASNGTLSLKGLSLKPSEINHLSLNFNSLAVVELDLSHNILAEQITDLTNEEAKNFANCLKRSMVETLDLSKNKIHDKGIKVWMHYLEGSSVTTLKLVNTLLGDKGIRYLVSRLSKTNIKHLYVGSNFIYKEGAAALANAIKKNKQLLTLDLTGCRIEDEDIECLAKCIPKSSLKTLILRENKLGTLSIEEFTNNLYYSQVNTLDLSHNASWYQPKHALKRLALAIPYTSITTLNLQNSLDSTCDPTTAQSFAENLAGSAVINLDLSHNYGMSVATFEALAKSLPNTKIQKLYLDQVTAKDNGSQAFFNNFKGSLELLSFTGNYVTSQGVKTLFSRLKDFSIKTLRLSSNYIDDKGAITLAKHLEEVKEIHLALDNNRFTKKGIQALTNKIMSGNVSLKVKITMADFPQIEEAIRLHREPIALVVDQVRSVLINMEIQLRSLPQTEKGNPYGYMQQLDFHLSESVPLRIRKIAKEIIYNRFHESIETNPSDSTNTNAEVVKMEAHSDIPSWKVNKHTKPAYRFFEDASSNQNKEGSTTNRCTIF